MTNPLIQLAAIDPLLAEAIMGPQDAKQDIFKLIAEQERSPATAIQQTPEAGALVVPSFTCLCGNPLAPGCVMCTSCEAKFQTANPTDAETLEQLIELPRTLVVHQTNVAIKAMMWREARIAMERALTQRKAADFLGEGTEDQLTRFEAADNRVYVCGRMVEEAEEKFWIAVDELAAALPETMRP